jgi:hypothetical protein
MSPSKIERLQNAGFVHSGTFRGPTFVGELPESAGVYAFVVADEVMYIGAAQKGLRHRKNSYLRNQAHGRSTRPVHSKLADALKHSDGVHMFIAIAPKDGEWNGLPVNTIAGLEEGLIREFKPVWNRRGSGAG